MPHSKTLPLSDIPGSIRYELQHGGHRENYWLANLAGYEDGLYPDGPQWGQPGLTKPRMTAEYLKGRAKGTRVRGFIDTAAPGEVEAARHWLTTSSGETDTWSVRQVVSLTHSRYLGGWRRFQRDLQENMKSRG